MIRRLFRRLAFLICLLGVLSYFYGLRPTDVPERTPLTTQVDHITIDKSDRTMTVWGDGTALRTYNMRLGFAPSGDKEFEGDGKTPEGIFKINRRNPNSAFHLSLGLDYPHPDDIARANAVGKSAGGDIFIHGQPNAQPDAITNSRDWTAGCIAVSNAEMEELWQVVQIGTTVEITP